MTRTQNQSTYMPQLDSLRALAIASVFCEHFNYLPNYFTRFIHFGRLGVDLFFMLSGFLITGILLKERQFKYAHQTSGILHFCAFYLRRALRIFPAYYLTILALTFLKYPPVTNHLFSHITYTSNLLMCFGKVSYGVVSHFWSLCVEEQFYLLWPFVILYAPEKRLPQIILGFILMGPLSKFCGSIAGMDWATLTRTPLGCAETLGGGAFLAYCQHMGRQNIADRFKNWGLRLGLPFLVSLQILRGMPFHPAVNVERIIYVTLVDLTASLAFFPLLLQAIDGFKDWRGNILNSRFLKHLGKISYGIYLFHLPLKPILNKLSSKVGIHPGAYLLILDFMIASGLASLSWFFIENPINRLKDKVPYPGGLQCKS